MLLSFNMNASSEASGSRLFAGLTALALLVLVLGVGDAAFGIVRTHTSHELTTPVTIAPTVEQQVDVLAAQPRGQTRADVRVDVVETDDTLVRSVVMVVDTLQAVAVGIGLLLTIRVLGSSSRGQAFTAENVRRMTSIGWLALAFLAVSVVEVATTLWAQNRLGSGSRFSEVSFVSGIAALAVFALAQVWSRGVELEELDAATV
jgi:hypothetical protein